MAETSGKSATEEWRASWALVIAAMIGYSISSIPAGSTGVMMGPIEQDFGWTRTQIYSGVSLISFIAFFVAPFLGAAIDRVGAKPIALAAAVLFCGGVAGLSLVEGKLWQWLLGWSVIGLAAAAMPTVWLSPLPARFTASRGLAVAVVLSGSGIATFLVPIIGHALVESYGWRGGYVGLGAMWAVASIPLILLFFRSDAASTGGAAPPSPGQRAALPGVSVREGLRSSTFWKLLVGAFCGIYGGVAIVMNLVPVLVSSGIEKGSAAAVSGLIGIATIAGRVTGGWLMDRMSAKVIAALSTFMACVLPLGLLAFPGSVAGATAAIITYGLFGGAKMGAIAYLTSRHIGQKAFATLYGTINAAVALAVATSPLIANAVYDVTRSYDLVMWLAIPVLLLGSFLYAILPGYPQFETSVFEEKRA